MNLLNALHQYTTSILMIGFFVVIVWLGLRVLLNQQRYGGTLHVERRAVDKPAATTSGATASDEAQRRRLAMERIQTVHEDVERRSADICERIEHGALFLLSHEPTAEFERFDITVRDAHLDALGTDEVSKMAATLETLWRAAVEHAEQVGLDALRDPKLGRTALSLHATMADTSATMAERATARAKLLEALRELNIKPTRAQLEGMHPELEA